MVLTFAWRSLRPYLYKKVNKNAKIIIPDFKDNSFYEIFK